MHFKIFHQHKSNILGSKNLDTTKKKKKKKKKTTTTTTNET